MNDVIVIGGGIAGISLAAHLSAHADVLVLEAEAALGYHASGRSAAMFEETYGSPSTIELNRASRPAHEASGFLSPRGLMLIGTAANADAFDADMVTMAMTPLSVSEARRMIPVLNPKVVTRAGHHSAAWDIDTDALIQSFARTLRANGGRLQLNAQVTAISRAGTHWQVTTASEVFTAPVLVNAAGAWADHIAALADVQPIGLTPFRRSMARIPAPGGLDLSRWPMMFGPGETWYAKPDAGALLVSPADEEPAQPCDAWPDDMVLAEGLARYSEHVTEPVTRLLSSWAGLRSFSPDRNLTIGPAPDAPGFFWQAGQGGYGFQTCHAAAQLGADLIVGRAPLIGEKTAQALAPARFF